MPNLGEIVQELTDLSGGVRAAVSRRVWPRLLRWNSVQIGEGVRFDGRPVIVAWSDESLITIGARSSFISRTKRTALGVNHPVTIRTLHPFARITIGEDVGMSGGTICAARSVTIGDGSLLGANVTIADTDFHPVVHEQRRYAPQPEPLPGDEITIGRNVFIGTGAIILKGTTIGDNSVVGAGAVVKGDFPDNSIVAGNPARVIRTITVESRN